LARQLKIDLTKKKWKNYSDLPIGVKSIIESRFEKIRCNNLMEGVNQFVDTEGKTIKEVLHGIHLEMEKYQVDWEVIVPLAEETNSNESLPEPLMELLLKYYHLNYLMIEVHHLWDWLEGLDDFILALSNNKHKNEKMH
jgi:hypothetical protein